MTAMMTGLLPAATDRLTAEGVVVPTMYETTDAGEYRAAISEARSAHSYSACVHVYDVTEYEAMRLFLTADRTAGFALNGDDVVSAFVHPDSPHKGCARALLALAIDLGGRRCDAFDTVLPGIYALEGMEAVARLPWDDRYAPEGWDYGTFSKYNGGRPDVVFMAYNPETVGVPYSGGGISVRDYDAAVEAVDARLNV